MTDGNNDIVLATADGMSIRFHESDVREMGRAATGVKGIELDKDDEVIGMVVIRRDATLLVVTEKGIGKRSELAEYRVQKRGGKGIITLKNTDKTGALRRAQGSAAGRRADDDHQERHHHPGRRSKASGSSAATPRASR